MAFCDLSHIFHKLINNVSQHVLTSPLRPKNVHVCSKGHAQDLTFGRPELQLEHDSQLSIRGNVTGWLELTSDGICNR